MGSEKKLFSIKCKSCGAAVGYDIPSQSYRCVHCGSITNAKEATTAWKIAGVFPDQDIHSFADTIPCPHCGATADLDRGKEEYRCDYCGEVTTLSTVNEAKWRDLNAGNWKKVTRDDVVAECPTCGARVIFKAGEASQTCEFCGSKLVESSLQQNEELPEFVIPFVLTEDEAKQRLLDWTGREKDNKDTRRVKQNINALQGYYLPYRMIRGPLDGIAYRDLMSRHYFYRGFLDYELVNASGQLDNQILDAAEPFDLSGLRPFDPGYIGGQRVKLSDISEASIQQRTLEESAERYRPYVAKVLHNNDAEVRVDHGEFLQIPILLPVYIQKVGKYMAVVNGQTGKVAVGSSKTPKESKRWLIEPGILTLLAVIAAAVFFGFNLEAISLAGVLAGLVFFVAYGQDRNAIILRKIYQGKDSIAHRKDGALELQKSDELMKNAFSNTPVFYEKEGEQEFPVEMKFYSVGRILEIVIRLGIMVFLPAILAAGIYLVSGGRVKELSGLPWKYGGAWYVLTGGIAIIYWIRGVRWDAFNHPILYRVMPDGSRKLFGSRRSRKMSILSLFGLDSWSNIKKLGGLGMAMIGFFIFVLLGSTLAIIF